MRVLTIVFLLAAIVAAQAANEKPADHAAAARGHATFVQNCAFCHGSDATGGRAPDLIRSALVRHDVDGNLIAPVIRNGRPQKGMPAFTLTDVQIAELIAFLHERVTTASSEPGSDYPLQRLLTGNAAAGARFFNGAGGCTKCHSTTGDLAGIARRLQPLTLQQHMLFPPDSPPTRVTIRSASGQVVSGTLADQDEFSIAMYDANGWYHSYPRAGAQVEIQDPRSAHRRLLNTITNTQLHDLFAFLETLK